MKFRYGVAMALAMTVMSPAVAGDDAIATRQALMKAVGSAAKVSAGMIRGQMEFNANTADLALRTLYVVATTYPSYFPEGSESGGDSEASPKIWEDAAGFKAATDKFEADALAAIGGAKDADSFKAAFGKVAANCKSCHESYRVMKN